MMLTLLLILAIIIISVATIWIVFRREDIRKNIYRREMRPMLGSGIIKEKIHHVKQADEWFEEGVKNQNLGNYEIALNFYSKALDIFTKKDYPYAYATIQNNIGIIYKELATIKKLDTYLYKAIRCYEEAINIFDIILYFN